MKTHYFNGYGKPIRAGSRRGLLHVEIGDWRCYNISKQKKGGAKMHAKYTVDEIRNIVAPIAKEYGVDSLYLFGSYSRGNANEKSDIDVRIDKGNIRSLFTLTGFRVALEDALKLPVDIVTSDISDKNFLKMISDEEVLLYRKA